MLEGRGVARSDIQASSVLTTIGAAVLIGAALVYLGLGVSYPLFHLIVEFFAIAVALATFMIAWNSRRRAENGYLVFLGIAYLFVAGLDLLHAVSFRGTSLVPGASTNLATQLWLAARYLQASALLIAPYYIDRRVSGRAVFWSYAAATALLVGAIIVGVFPVAYQEPGGLTTFKIASELIVAAFMAIGLGLLWSKREDVDPSVMRLMTASIGLLVVAELAFSGYVDDPYHGANMVGHLLRILSYYLLYVALVRTSLERPAETLFRELSKTADALRDSEARYRSTFERATLGIAHVSLDGRWLMANRVMSSLTGYDTAELLRMKPEALTYPDDREAEQRMLTKLADGEMTDYRLEKRIVRKDGSLLWVNSSTARLGGSGVENDYLISIVEDITERKAAEKDRARGRELSDALNTIDRTVLASLDTDTILQRVIEDSSTVLRADASVVLERSGAQSVVRRIHRLDPDMLGSLVPTHPAGPTDEALTSGKALWIPQPDEAAEMTRDWLERAGFCSMLVVPLMFRDDEIGSVVFLWDDEPQEFSEAELTFARQALGDRLDRHGERSSLRRRAGDRRRPSDIADRHTAGRPGTRHRTGLLQRHRAHENRRRLLRRVRGGSWYDRFRTGRCRGQGPGGGDDHRDGQEHTARLRLPRSRPWRRSGCGQRRHRRADR